MISISAAVAFSAESSVVPEAESTGEPADIPVVASAPVPDAKSVAEFVVVPVTETSAVPATVTMAVPVAVTTDIPATYPSGQADIVLASSTNSSSCEVTKSHLPVEYIELVDLYVSTISRETSDTEKSGSLSVESIESIIDNNSPKTANSSDAVSKNPRYAAHKRKIPSDEKIQERSVPVVQRTSACSART
ncbi:hypothetical protein AYI69_g9138 [Smittium culicis]|uniref:Uncharacterized protein n=1 Tax=Smittium culicis TaxID=133412 RepID=A0A1R1XEP0_9FUNG|nr:hypothetical protein AYI69_g9138 [Smittium culicis]